eukprot:GHVP01011054.1.p1 GENE.GHVP01011054.1~~GHVP01011054.1.p1  ORF type:complete len:142 (+),score=16.41 GHVP01011054.1:350-775(+)
MSVHDYFITFFEIFDHQFFSYFENKTQGVFEAKKGKSITVPFQRGRPWNMQNSTLNVDITDVWCIRTESSRILRLRKKNEHTYVVSFPKKEETNPQLEKFFMDNAEYVKNAEDLEQRLLERESHGCLRSDSSVEELSTSRR